MYSIAPSHGYEQELQIVDPNTGGLKALQSELLKAGQRVYQSNRYVGFDKEAYTTQLEYRVGIAENVQELMREMRQLRESLFSCAESLGVTLMAAGTNPITETKRPGENFGDHHHVGIGSAIEAMNFHNYARSFIPELIAVSANSPGYANKDTGYASYRIKRSHHIALPPIIEKNQIGEIISHSNGRPTAIFGANPRYYDVTPFVKSGIPTVEIRLFDAQCSLRVSMAIVTVLQALLRKVRLLEDEELLGAQDPNLASNRTVAFTAGIDGVCDLSHRPVLPLGKRVSLRDAIGELVGWLETEIDSLGFNGCTSRDILSILATDNINARLIKLFRQSGVKPYIQEVIRLTKGGD